MFNIELISAEEAAVRTKAAKDKASDEQMVEIVKSIEEAIKQGEYSVKIPQKLLSKNGGILKTLGYHVTESFIEMSFLISWKQMSLGIQVVRTYVNDKEFGKDVVLVNQEDMINEVFGLCNRE